MRVRIISASRTYWREIAVLLAAKVVALLLIKLMFFTERPVLPPAADHLFKQAGMQ
jgi:hypothetical protein